LFSITFKIHFTVKNKCKLNIFFYLKKKKKVFNGTVVEDNIKEYKYVAIDNQGHVIDEESITREYTDETSEINEVYNR